MTEIVFFAVPPRIVPVPFSGSVTARQGNNKKVFFKPTIKKTQSFTIFAVCFLVRATRAFKPSFILVHQFVFQKESDKNQKLSNERILSENQKGEEGGHLALFI